MIPYGRQQINRADIDAVIAVLQSDWLTQGPMVTEFERQLCQLTGATDAVAMNSATSALHVACLALGLGPGDWLWTSPNSFVASANCGLYCGARVDFVDIDPQSYNLCPQALAEKLAKAERNGTLPKVIVVVHFAGQSAPMDAIGALAKRYGIKLIEDASHAVGGRYQGKPVGACTHSEITVFSFHPVKIITTAEGGAALTRCAQLAGRIRQLSSHGITREAEQMQGESHGPWYYQQIALGMNYRMTDIQAALGCSQLQRIDEFIRQRTALVARYNEALDGELIIKPLQSEHSQSAFHLYPIQLRHGERKAVFEQLRSQGIGVNVHYIPIHTQPWYRQQGFNEGMFPQAERYYQHALSLPLYPDLSESDQAFVIEQVNTAAAKAHSTATPISA